MVEPTEKTTIVIDSQSKLASIYTRSESMREKLCSFLNHPDATLIFDNIHGIEVLVPSNWITIKPTKVSK